MSSVKQVLIGLCLLFPTAILGTSLQGPDTQLVKRADPLPPSKDPFYQPPVGWQNQKPGTILRTRELHGIDAINGLSIAVKSIHQFLYRSNDALNNPMATVNTVLVPYFADPLKHVSYQTAYDQPCWDCAPSFSLQQNAHSNATATIQIEIVLMSAALKKGYTVSTSDYQGPKLNNIGSAFTVGPAAAHGVLDSIRAVVQNSGNITGLSPQAKTVMWGYSGGSLATEWASEFKVPYAPELKILGAAAGGLPVNLTKVLATVNNSSSSGLIAAGLWGFAAQYPEAASYLNQHLKPATKEYFKRPLYECEGTGANEGEYLHDFANQDIFSYFDNGNALLSSAVYRGLLKSSGVMGQHALPDFPLYLYKGVADEVTPPIQDTDNLYQHFCDNGVTVKYYRYDNGTHGTTALAGSGGAFKFLSGLLDGGAVSKSCEKIEVNDGPSGLADPSLVTFLIPAIANEILSVIANLPHAIFPGL